MSSRPPCRPLGEASALTFAELTRELGVGDKTLQAFLDRHGIKPYRFAPGPRGLRYRMAEVWAAAPREGEPDVAQGLEPRRRTSGRPRIKL